MKSGRIRSEALHSVQALGALGTPGLASPTPSEVTCVGSLQTAEMCHWDPAQQHSPLTPPHSKGG